MFFCEDMERGRRPYRPVAAAQALFGDWSCICGCVWEAQQHVNHLCIKVFFFLLLFAIHRPALVARDIERANSVCGHIR